MSPYQIFNNWLFDGRLDTPIPKPKVDDDGKIIVPDLLKYNSPITSTYIVSLFLRHGSLNKYLNNYFNDINLRYITKEELFKFIKKCIHEFRIKKKDIMFYKRTTKILLYEKLREKMPVLKNDDVLLLCDLIENSDEKEMIFNSLGLDNPKKTKIKKVNKIKEKKISVKELLERHFSIIEQ